MKKLIVLLVVLFFFDSLLMIAKDSSKPLFAWKKDSLWHFADYQGNEFIPPQNFENVGGYSEGLISVSALVKGNEKWGFIDLKGKFVIPPKYDKANVFSDGYAVVYEFVRSNDIPVIFSFIDKNGVKLNKEDLIDATDFSEGSAYYMNVKRESGYLDVNGNKLIDLKGNIGNKFYNGLASVSDETLKSGFFDKSGNKIIGFKYETVGNYSEGKIAVFINGRFAYINSSDSILLPPVYDYAREFRNKRAFVGSLNSRSGKILWGLIDTSGIFIKDYSLIQINDFTNDIAAVRDSVNWFYINTQGELLFNDNFSFASNFVDDYAWASKKSEKLFGYINRKGEYVLKFNEFDKAIDLRLNKRVY